MEAILQLDIAFQLDLRPQLLSPAAASTSAASATSNSPAGAASVINGAHNISTVTINGIPTSVDTYSINGNNYFKLRDVASAMNFGVNWDGATSTIAINTAAKYTE